MNIKTKFYWSLYIQWLAEKDILNEWLDNVLSINVPTYTPYMWRGIDNEPVFTRNGEPDTTAWSNVARENRLNIYLDFELESCARRQGIDKRLSLVPYNYEQLMKQDHMYNRRSWYSITGVFCDEVLTQRVKRISTNRIKKHFNSSCSDITLMT